MRGFQPSAQRAINKSSGGMVRGPGTGTSDDVADVVPPGTYIMPADSTRAVGPQRLSAGDARGFKPGSRSGVPVQLSAGEYKLSPDQVHAIGAQVLDQVKDATHQPARGFVSGRFPVQRLEDQDSGERQFFADGGLVEEKRPNSFGDAAAAAKDPSVTIPAGFAPGGAPASSTTPEASAQPTNDRAARGFHTGGDPSVGTDSTMPGTAAAPSNITKTVDADGRTTYSGMSIGGDATVNGRGLAQSSGITPVGHPLQSGVASGGASPVVGTLSSLPGSPTSGVASGVPTPAAGVGFQAPTQRYSGNDWKSSHELRNAEVSANSITNNGGRWDQHKGMSPAREKYAAMLGADSAARGAQAGLDAEAMRQNAAIQSAGMAQQSAMARTVQGQLGAFANTAAREQGENQRAQLAAGTDLQVANINAHKQGIPAGYRWGADGASLEAIPGGPADSTSGAKPLSESQNKSLQFGVRMQSSGQNMDRLAAAGVDQPGLIKRAADTVGLGTLANWTQSPQQQQVEQSQRDFVNAVLRRESGAAISASEFDNARKQYFPQIGDSPEVAEQKRQNRELATRGMLAEVPNQERRVASVAGQQRTVSRTGTVNGRRVVQYSDGSIEYAN